ncbi:MAG: prepilin-type N-terminal cleavage/methylation domain-containing protein [Nitrospirae bacterium]|nr:prepilin-type N-terminal cleavage/methylation domain-containing protein [Nitrospirota bacterium]
MQRPDRTWNRAAVCRAEGYTLIEVLVALAIFTAMVMFCVMALQQSLMQYKSVMEEGVNFWKYGGKFWLHKSTGGMVGYYVEDDQKQWFPYFLCNGNVVSYVSLSPLTGKLPVVVWLVKEKAKAAGLYSLVYYELPVYTYGYKDIERLNFFGDYKKGGSFVILEGVSGIVMEVYAMNQRTGKWEWKSDYDTRQSDKMPGGIRITYTGDGKRHIIFLAVHTNSSIKPNPYVI